MFEFDVAPAGKVPGPHSHDGYEETTYRLDGTLTFTVAGKLTELGPGQVLFIPRSAMHLRQLPLDHSKTPRHHHARYFGTRLFPGSCLSSP